MSQHRHRPHHHPLHRAMMLAYCRGAELPIEVEDRGCGGRFSAKSANAPLDGASSTARWS
jgi:hypothetical protein